MKKLAVLLTLVVTSSLSFAQITFDSLTRNLTRTDGFYPYYYDENAGKLYLEVDAKRGDFIYVSSLATGVGSNDLGLDRGQLGGTRLVRFRKIGPTILLEQPNLSFRAVSDNPAEAASVQEAFASSVLAGFPIVASKGNVHLIELTSFLLRDTHGVGKRLKQSKQGNLSVDKSRSVIYPERTKNFPKNTEFEALITLTGNIEGRQLRSVTPDGSAVTIRQHHSFVALPKDGYTPREFDIRAGYFMTSYQDYAAPIGSPLTKRFINRHRLEKQNPNAASSPAKEPIVYYLDRGAPEPVKSALLDGARWWNDAFAAAGFENAFRVEVLPDGIDPMDVRYNVIQWVHRSTRGWSYGASVTDPRTGEIIKGHVSLGSLRIRQDYLLAQGLIDAYNASGQADPRLLEFALARLRQLGAHEVGHTLGLAHNYASSMNDRASVMDYPHPYVTLGKDGLPDLSNAYDTGIGEWDKQAIKYGYSTFANAAAEQKGLTSILAENQRLGLDYISDKDARATGGAHPDAHLWDSGTDATAELNRILDLRAVALNRLNENNLAPGRPLAELENVLVPVYLMHRYQVEAASKLVGGVDYDYTVNVGMGAATKVVPVQGDRQRRALTALMRSISPEVLSIPKPLLDILPPQPPGYRRNRELFDTQTGLIPDPQAAAAAAIDQTLGLLLHEERIARVHQQDILSPDEISKGLITTIEKANAKSSLRATLTDRAFAHALALAADENATLETRAYGLDLAKKVLMTAQGSLSDFLGAELIRFGLQPETFKRPARVRVPDGSPIGSHQH